MATLNIDENITDYWNKSTTEADRILFASVNNTLRFSPRIPFLLIRTTVTRIDNTST